MSKNVKIAIWVVVLIVSVILLVYFANHPSVFLNDPNSCMITEDGDKVCTMLSPSPRGFKEMLAVFIPLFFVMLSIAFIFVLYKEKTN